MKINGKAKEKLQGVLRSTDALTSAYECMLLLFLIPYCVEREMLAVNAIIPLTMLVSLAVIPLAYTLLHRVSPLLFGRFHLFMPLSALFSAMSFVSVFGATDGGAASVLFTFGGLSAFFVFELTYKYCSFSVATRLGRGERGISAAFSAIGGAAAVGVTFGFYRYDPKTAYLNSAYVIAALCVIAAVIGYFATVSETPRLDGKTSLTVNDAYRTFYTDITAEAFFSTALLTSAFFALAALGVFLSSLSGGYAPLISSASIVVAFFVTRALSPVFRPRAKAVFVSCPLLLAVGGALMCFSLVAGGFWYIASVCGYGVCVGAGGALCPIFNAQYAPIKRGVSSGSAFLTKRIFALVAAAIAAAGATTAVTIALYFQNYTYFAYFIGLAVVSSVLGAVLSAKARKRATAAAVNSEGSDAAENK